MDGQISMFGPDTESGKMSRAHSVPQAERISASSSRHSSRLKNHPCMLLDLRTGAGNMLGSYWEIDPVWLGQLGTLNTSECPSGVVESSLWQILQPTAPLKYYLSPKACRGILRRAGERGKPLPEELYFALKIQAGISEPLESETF